MSQTERYKMVEVDDCVCSIATAKAILVVCEGEEAWIPTSQVHEDSEVYKPGTEGTLVIPRWVAEMKDEGAAVPGNEVGAMRAMRVCTVGLVFALTGCATARPQASIPATPMRAAGAPEERQPEGWPPYYPPRLVRDLAGTDATTGEASIERGYVLHRIDLEKVRVLDARAARCDQDLGVRSRCPAQSPWALCYRRSLGTTAGHSSSTGLLDAP